MRGGCGGAREGGEIVVAKLRSMEDKRDVMERERALKGRAVRIADDWTWKERKMQWRLKEIAAKEERNGRRVWVSYGRIRIDEEWWKWDEEKEVLRDRREREREEEGKEERGRGEEEVGRRERGGRRGRKREGECGERQKDGAVKRGTGGKGRGGWVDVRLLERSRNTKEG